MDVLVGRRHPVSIESRGAAGGIAPLGLLERWYAAQPQPRVFCIAAELEEPLGLTPERLVVAMRDVASRHGLLRASLLVGPDADAAEDVLGCMSCFVSRGRAQAPRFLVRSVDEFQRLVLPVRLEAAGRAWPEAFAELANESFRDAGPARAQLQLLWKLLYLPPVGPPGPARTPGGALLLVCHHALGDGLSGASVMLELLETLARAELPAGPPVPGPPPDLLESKVDVRAQLGDMARALYSCEDACYVGPAQPPAPVQRRPVGGLPGATLPALKTPAPILLERPAAPLLRRCRAAGTSVHAALCAAALFAVAAVTRDREPPLLASLSVPVSLRGRAGVPPRAVGNYICGAKTRHAIRPTTRFTTLAAAVRAGVAADVPRATRELGMLQVLGDGLEERVLQRCEEAGPAMRTSTLEVSNLGALPRPALPAALRFAQASHCDGPLFTLSAATSGGASSEDERAVLSVAITYPEPFVEAAAARRFAGAFTRALDTFLNHPLSTDFSLAELLSLWYTDAPSSWRQPPEEAASPRDDSPRAVGCTACTGSSSADHSRSYS